MVEKKGGNKNKAKGSRFEREIRLKLLPFYPKVQTSRLSSQALDNSGVDLVNTGNILVQCKFVESKKCFDFEELHDNVFTCLKKYFEENDPVHKKEFVLIHKKNGRKKSGTSVTITLDYFLELQRINDNK